ncbi:hypothetical protein N7475_010593 [Penicillium sp. IBT 31633x]|nr:hypothetical protein N7475_010593 [Penicillium sp. IBT 31633x]
MPALLDKAPTTYQSRQEPSRRSGAMHIPSNTSTTPTVFVRLFSSPNQQKRDAMPQFSANSQLNSLKTRAVRRQPRKPLTGSARRTPLQQISTPPQPGANTIDRPGTGGGKENVPPGMYPNTKTKSKSDQLRLVSTMPRQAPSPRNRMMTSPKEVREELAKRVSLGQSQVNRVRAPKPSGTTPACTTRASLSKRSLSAIIIQRAWRSFVQRRNDHAHTVAIAKVRAQWACDVIARWWRSIKVSKLRGQIEQTERIQEIKLSKQTEQLEGTDQTEERTGKPKPKNQKVRRQSARQSSGRRGIRRL